MLTAQARREEARFPSCHRLGKPDRARNGLALGRGRHHLPGRIHGDFVTRQELLLLRSIADDHLGRTAGDPLTSKRSFRYCPNCREVLSPVAPQKRARRNGVVDFQKML